MMKIALRANFADHTAMNNLRVVSARTTDFQRLRLTVTIGV